LLSRQTPTATVEEHLYGRFGWANASERTIAPGALTEVGRRTPPQRSLLTFALIGLGPLATVVVFAISVALVQRLGWSIATRSSVVGWRMRFRALGDPSTSWLSGISGKGTFMFGISRTTAAHPLSKGLRQALLGVGPPSSTDGDAHWVVEDRGHYAGRSVTHFRIFDQARAARASVRIRAYDDLEQHPEFVLRAGHVEGDGSVVFAADAPSVAGPTPARQPADRTAHGDDDHLIFWDSEGSRSSAAKLSLAAVGWLQARSRPAPGTLELDSVRAEWRRSAEPSIEQARKERATMFRIERTITIHRPIEEVFGYLSDVEHGPTYISGQRTARKTSTGPVGLGTTFVTSGGMLHRSLSYRVTEYQPYSRLGWQSTSGRPATMTWGFEPSGPSTRVTFTSVVSMAGPLRLGEPIMEGFARGRVDSDLGRLKELLAVTRTSAATQRSW
jgi:uncharacterized protein YndB with AHSA1/START domain